MGNVGAVVHKPFLPLDAQVELLRSRGMIVDTRTAWTLEREGYYAVINGYKQPFLDLQATERAGDDRYRAGVSFSDVYAVFVFDRKLRQLIFEMTTLAEATLKTICAYRFTAVHRHEVNPYLFEDNYDSKKREKAKGLIGILRKILESAQSASENRSEPQSYLAHYVKEYDGEVPLWVLTNALTLGQIYWFYEALPSSVTGEIADSFTGLYNDSHKHRLPDNKRITTDRIDKIYRRIKDYRNICAHDERLYCAHPHDANVTIFQLVKDLRWVIDKKRYLEFLQRFNSLVMSLEEDVADDAYEIIREMGFSRDTEFSVQFTEYQQQMEKL